MRARFEAAFHGLQLSVPEGAYERVRAAYGEPHRHYHTLAHIEQCLAWLDWAWAGAERPHELALALWYHDYVYDPARSDNEAASARVMRSELASAQESLILRVESLISSTREHAVSTGDAALMTDIDLAILGAEPDEFATFECQVRAEYARYDDHTYARGRARVLTRLLARSPLYATPFFAAELSLRARRNLQSTIARLNSLA